MAHTILLSQATYIDTILLHSGMTESFSVSTPLDPNVILTKLMSPASDKERLKMGNKMGNIPYLAHVGSLMYASMATWPDITFATNSVNLNPTLASLTGSHYNMSSVITN